LEEEISLLEIITALWKGKYIIISITLAAMLITALISFFMITPLYKTTATFDPAPYKYKAADIVRTNGNNTILYIALEDLVEDPAAVLANTTITAEGELVVITAEQPEPHLAVATADTVALAIAQTTATDYLETINHEIFTLQGAISFYEDKIAEFYPDADSADNETLLEDPIYLALRQEQGNLTRNLFNAMIAKEQLEISDQLNYELHIESAPLPKQPYNLRWQLNLAVSAVLGLMVSVFVVFTIPAVRSLKEKIT
jgi:hypothetical protein